MAVVVMLAVAQLRRLLRRVEEGEAGAARREIAGLGRVEEVGEEDQCPRYPVRVERVEQEFLG